MKRVATRLLDHVIVSFWTTIGVVLVYGVIVMAIHNDWSMKPGTLGDAFQWMFILLAWASTPRYLTYWGLSGWLGLVVQATSMTVHHLLLVGQEAPMTRRLTSATFVALSIVLFGAPILARMGWVPHIRWPRVLRSRGEYVKRQQELRAAQEELARLASEQ